MIPCAPAYQFIHNKSQVITGSHDHTIRLWDLRKGSTISTLTYHKKSVRAMAMHPSEHAFASASAENIKKFRLPEGEFLHNMLQQQRAIVNSMAINEDGVMMTGGDNGSLWCVLMVVLGGFVWWMLSTPQLHIQGMGLA